MDRFLRTYYKRLKIKVSLLPRELKYVFTTQYDILSGKKKSDQAAADTLGISIEEFMKKKMLIFKLFREFDSELPIEELEPESDKKVFISYSHDSEEHKDWVMKLANRLMFSGIEVIFDRFHLKPGMSSTLFMEKGISEADYIICVFTPNYAKKANMRDLPSGTGYEQQIITGQIISGVNKEKFIPILREGEYMAGKNCAIPIHFQGTYCEDFRNDEKFTTAINNIIATMHEMTALAVDI